MMGSCVRIRKRRPITHEEVVAALNYDPSTGVLSWNGARRGLSKNPFDNRTPSKKDGYLRIGFNGNRLLVHRVIWFYMTGVWPVEVDHINGLRHDNRWVNLREVTRAKNLQNIPPINPRNKSTGLVGSSFSERYGKFRSYIVVGRKQKSLGFFDTAEEAHSAYLKAKATMHTHNERMFCANQ